MTSTSDNAVRGSNDIFRNADGSWDKTTLAVLVIGFVAIVGFFSWNTENEVAASARAEAEAIRVCEELLDAARSGRLTAADLAAGGCRQEARTFVIERAAVPSLAPSKL